MGCSVLLFLLQRPSFAAAKERDRGLLLYRRQKSYNVFALQNFGSFIEGDFIERLYWDELAYLCMALVLYDQPSIFIKN